MKKLLLLFVFLLPALAWADSKTDYQFNPEQLIIDASLVLVLYIVSTFIISLVKMRLHARFRDKLIESDRSEEMVDRLLRPIEQDRKADAFRATVILGGITVGLGLASATTPMGLHSIAIVTFCLALSFLGYYFYLDRRKSD